MGDELIPATLVARICGMRGAALAKMDEAVAAIERGHALATEAASIANGAHEGAVFYLEDRTTRDAYKRLFEDFDGPACREMFRASTDARTWVHLLERTGLRQLMDREEMARLNRSLTQDVPEVTEDSVFATFDRLRQDARTIFLRGLAKAFSGLDRRFKSHDAFKIGSRIILSHCFYGDGWWYQPTADVLVDIERAFQVLAGVHDLDPTSIIGVVNNARGPNSWGPRQSYVESTYFRIRTFKNGNAHLWMRDDSLVEKANLALAEYYGAVLPDAVSADPRGDDLRSKSGELSTDLAFYPTSAEVAKVVVDRAAVCPGDRVLEPSAGDGALVRALLQRGAAVEAIEVDSNRAKAVEALHNEHIVGVKRAWSPAVRDYVDVHDGPPWDRLRVVCANFLQVPAVAEFDAVVMNPPFHGTHWMQHVRHAFDFLRPGGQLVTILPIGAELNESPPYARFRAWAQPFASGRYAGGMFSDLPPESFAHCGVRTNTVILKLQKPEEVPR
jgi:SAM-dependent methyltransferase